MKSIGKTVNSNNATAGRREKRDAQNRVLAGKPKHSRADKIVSKQSHVGQDREGVCGQSRLPVQWRQSAQCSFEIVTCFSFFIESRIITFHNAPESLKFIGALAMPNSFNRKRAQPRCWAERGKIDKLV